MTIPRNPSIKRRGTDFQYWVRDLGAGWKMESRTCPIPMYKQERLTLPFSSKTYTTGAYSSARERRTMTYVFSCHPSNITGMQECKAGIFDQFKDMKDAELRDNMLRFDDPDNASNSDYYTGVDLESITFEETPNGHLLRCTLVFTADPLTNKGHLL